MKSLMDVSALTENQIENSRIRALMLTRHRHNSAIRS